MAMAKRIMPKALRRIFKPVLPSNFSSRSVFFNMKYTKSMLKIIPTMMF